MILALSGKKPSDKILMSNKFIRFSTFLVIEDYLTENFGVAFFQVSNGAECVLIKGSWFLQHANEAMLRKLRNQVSQRFDVTSWQKC